ILMDLEIEQPRPLRYIIGAAIMMVGVVLPVGFMMLRNKRVLSSSSSSYLVYKSHEVFESIVI
ncbi:hypothetical protein MKW92_033854, partial [Papaver armeniacum]